MVETARSALRALLLSAVPAIASQAQEALHLRSTVEGGDVVVQAEAPEEGTAAPLFRAIWRKPNDGHATFELQRTRAEDAGATVPMDRFLEAGIGAYLDANVHFTKQGVVADRPAQRLMADMNAMVAAALEVRRADVVFPGFGQPTLDQLERLVRIDWSQASAAVDSGSEQDKYLAIYYYVRSQRDELERQLRADLLPFSSVPVFEEEATSPGTTVRINSTCGTVFDQDNFLCALDLQLADSGNGSIDPELGAAMLGAMAQRAQVGERTEMSALPASRVRKRDRWLKEELDAIHERIERMDQRKELWELRDRMEDLEDRLTGLELDMAETRTNTAEEDGNPLADLSDLTGANITVRFERYSTALAPDQQVMLNEVFEQLARSPLDQVLITGYTDRSGDPAVNLRLSEQRAKAVRAYLLQRGISAERLLVNFYGDSRSVGRDPGERRVEIEWIRP
jgi:outer membrane protein OmpA-like peptidoglycan-associated protein